MDKDLYLNFKFNYMSQENQTLSLFSDDQMPAKWEEEWVGMPEFKQQDENSFQSIIVHFRNEKDRKEFEELLQQKITYKTKSIWFPKYDREKPSNYVYLNLKNDES